MVEAKPEDDSQARLVDLQMVIKQVYLPTLEAKPDIKHSISKFSNQINTALQQAYGNVTINVPKLPASDEEVQKSAKYTEQIQKAVVSAPSFSFHVSFPLSPLSFLVTFLLRNRQNVHFKLYDSSLNSKSLSSISISRLF